MSHTKMLPPSPSIAYCGFQWSSPIQKSKLRKQNQPHPDPKLNFFHPFWHLCYCSKSSVLAVTISTVPGGTGALLFPPKNKSSRWKFIPIKVKSYAWRCCWVSHYWRKKGQYIKPFPKWAGKFLFRNKNVCSLNSLFKIWQNSWISFL